MTFRVGQKIVCVERAPFGDSQWDPDDGVPVEGEIYTIQQMHIESSGYLVLRLLEIRRGERARRWWGDDVGYGAYRFRPVVERATDVFVFHKILDDVNRKVPALASAQRDAE